MKSSIVIVLLAAGSSSRMGQSKQLLSIKGKPLLLKSAEVALGCEVDHVVVVLGSQEAAHQRILKDLPLEIIPNPDWQKGMGNSLKAGLNHTLRIIPDVGAIVIIVCDQPRLTVQHIKKLIQKNKETKNPIIASGYAETLGVPVLFGRSLFQELASLGDDQGAKKILKKYSSSILSVDFPDGSIDLDTMEDYHKFISSM
jgi:molybdenum cofactor cytidylyltransferase